VSGVGINSTAASLLGFLHDGPQTGWELVARAEQTIGPFWSLTRSQVYRELSFMAGHGLVTPGPVGRRDSRPYAITDTGRQAFSDWAADGPDSATMRLPLLLFVVLGRHIGTDRLAPMLVEQRRRQAELLAGYLRDRDRLREADTDPHLLATLEYGIAVARATVRWLDGLRPQLTGRGDADGASGV
jgi:DNA-binding PadR family transcriptional regulator